MLLVLFMWYVISLLIAPYYVGSCRDISCYIYSGHYTYILYGVHVFDMIVI